MAPERSVGSILTAFAGRKQVIASPRFKVGVNIDGTSIQVRALSHPNDVKVLNTSYPPNEPDPHAT